jgi:hypothetical protein
VTSFGLPPSEPFALGLYEWPEWSLAGNWARGTTDASGALDISFEWPHLPYAGCLLLTAKGASPGLRAETFIGYLPEVRPPQSCEMIKPTSPVEPSPRLSVLTASLTSGETVAIAARNLPPSTTVVVIGQALGDPASDGRPDTVRLGDFTTSAEGTLAAQFLMPNVPRWFGRCIIVWAVPDARVGGHAAISYVSHN